MDGWMDGWGGKVHAWSADGGGAGWRGVEWSGVSLEGGDGVFWEVWREGVRVGRGGGGGLG